VNRTPGGRVIYIFVFSNWMTFKLTLKVNDFPGHRFFKSSPYEGPQVRKEIPQIEPFVFELSAFLFFFMWMTLKLTFKLNEFRGHKTDISPSSYSHSSNRDIQPYIQIYSQVDYNAHTKSLKDVLQ
jgi:hypothetical protein